MKIQMFSFIPFCLILFQIDILYVSSHCLSDQQSILIQLKNTILFNSSLSTKIVSWNQNTDCCTWNGVICHTDGHVIGLDLSYEAIFGGIENSSALFSLGYLRSLNLAANEFNMAQIPTEIANLSNLEYLNLSSSGIVNPGFSGQIPVELSNMIRLVTLDLSNNYYLSGVGNSSLAIFLQNLKELTELYLDGVNLSDQGYGWCQAISSSLPKLKVLSLSYCLLSGPIDASFAKLQSLEVIRLSLNSLNGPVPEFLANFTNLTVLELSQCNLNGKFPGKILQLPTLETLDLSRNNLLNGFLPIFPQNASLQTLDLSSTNFSQTLPDSIGNLRMLNKLDLGTSNFSGQIPPSIASLTQLVYVDLSHNHFSGPIPSFQKSKNLTHLDLSDNGLSGPIPNTYFKGLLNLEHVDLGSNAFNGTIPSSLFSLSSLKNILLSNNIFQGLLVNLSNTMPSLLEELDLRSNRLEGPIPKSFFHLTSLQVLDLSNNLLNGTLELEAFSVFGDLKVLGLSNNNLSIETRGENSSLSLSPQLSSLELASCKLQHFPNLKNHTYDAGEGIDRFDLSNNQIGGEIPSWIWRAGTLTHINLSFNLLNNIQTHLGYSGYLTVLDLHSNRLQGEIPELPESAIYVDYSDNQFNSSLPIDIGDRLSSAGTSFYSISNNGITGRIPDSICTATGLLVLDLSNNHLSGTIPSCLVQLTESLGVLNLGKNNFSGNIPGTFTSNCSLATLDLQGNHFEGKVPESLGNCSMLGVLNLGKNNINDTFPCFLNKCTNLRVLSLGSNKLHGDIQCKGATKVWSKLQIINLASNYFTGHLPTSFFLNLSAMIADKEGKHSKLNHLHYLLVGKVAVVIKGKEIELVKILTIFTSIDLSNNWFSGKIPNSIGELNALYILNMSHNAFRGSIPSSIGNLRQLESFDLSMNNLSGMIPIELGNLTFLAFLNLSYNLLEGRIPAGPQLQTFSETSFEGNKLCGIQVNISCVNDHGNGPSSPPPLEEAEDNWFLISFEVGIVVGLAIVIAPLVLSRRWCKWYFEQVDRIVAAKVYQFYQRRNQERKKPIRFL